MDESKIAVLVPCYNEEMTVGKVVADFRKELPQATVYVYDNNSTDRTAEIAKEAGAVVRFEPRQGKGRVMRTMFAEIEADVYVLVDGDDTYPAENVHAMIKEVEEGRADMVVGDRLSHGAYAKENKRPGHNMGNSLVRGIINILFKANIHDVLTGYRVFTRAFVKNYPVLSQGFEVETAMTIHALDKGFKVREVEVDYRDRPEGSESKLNTVTDGVLVLKTLFGIYKNYRPMLFFSTFSLLFLLLGILCGVPPVIDYITSGWVDHVPMALLATGLVILAALSFVCALILDTVQKHHKESYELSLIRYYTIKELAERVAREEMELEKTENQP